MEINYLNEYKKVLSERGMALASKRSALQMKESEEIRKNELERILFGEDQNYGIIHYLSALYDQVWIVTGRKTAKPLLYDFNLAKSQYQQQFALSVTPSGDGVGGLHPPRLENSEEGEDATNENSDWFTHHELEEIPSNNNGIIPLINLLNEIIGVKATDTANGRGGYPDIILDPGPPPVVESSRLLAENRAEQDRGSGLLGKRTENSEIFAEVFNGLNIWYVGQSQFGEVEDTPDYFSNEGENLKNCLYELKLSLQNLRNTLSYEQNLLNNPGQIIEEFKIELFDDYDNIDYLTNNILNFLSELEVFINYFNQYSGSIISSFVRTEVNNILSNLKNDFLKRLYLSITTRIDLIFLLCGDVTSGLKKYLVYWVDKLVMKPDGPYAILYAVTTLINSAQKDIEKKNKELMFFTNDYSCWLETPEITVLAEQTIFDLNKNQIFRKDLNVIWNLVNAANKYKLLIKSLSDIFPIDNSAWVNSDEIWITKKSINGFLQNYCILSSPNEAFFYRIVAYDTQEGEIGDFDRIDVIDTHSRQSDIISEPLDFQQLQDSPLYENSKNELVGGRTVVKVNSSMQLKENDFVLVNNFYICKIFSNVDTNCALDGNYGEVLILQKLFGYYPNNEIIQEDALYLANEQDNLLIINGFNYLKVVVEDNFVYLVTDQGDLLLINESILKIRRD